MKALRTHRRLALVAALAPLGAMAAVLVPAGSALAATQTFPNACRNGAVPTNWDQVSITNTMTSPAGPVAPGATVPLTGISLSMAIPGAIFAAGYNLGLLTTGTNVIPGDIHEVIDGTNTVEGSQSTNTVSTTLTTVISDPNGIPGTGDETATDASASLTFNDQTWTAGPSAGTINFAEHNDPAINGASGGGIIAIAHLAGGFINVGFHCTSGTVVGSQPGVATLTDAPTVTSTTIALPNQAPTANAGPDQTVNSGSNVTLDGTGSSDPDGNALSYAWSQTAGPAVTLGSATTAHPTFTAPTGPTDLTFSLVVTDDGSPPLSSPADTVNVHVNAPADVTATSLGITPPTHVGEPITFNSDVTDTTTPGNIPVGIVSWYDNGSSTAAASSPTDPAGHATATLPTGFATTGSHSVVAKFVPTDSSLFQQSQSSPVVFELLATEGCSLPGSSCSDPQNFTATVAAGSLVISTPWTAANPFDLGTMSLDPTGTFLHTSAPFGTAALPGNGVTITDTRAGDLPWTASLTSSDFLNGGNSINACNLGFTGVTPVQIGANALGTAAKPVVPTDVPNGGAGGIAAPGAACGTGLAGLAHTFAGAAHGDGSVNIIGVMDLYAPTSTPAGVYNATVTFTIA